MVKDILLDIEASDVLFSDKLDDAFIYYETIWGKVFDTDDEGTLFLNIIVPYSQQRTLTFSQDGVYSCNILAQYCPEDRNFKIRFIINQNGEYVKFNTSDDFPEYVVGKSYIEDFYNLSPISACQLLNIDINGKYKIVIRKGDVVSAEIYSFGNKDLLFGESDDQSAKLLSLCAPGKNYRYPISGVGITDYINTVIGDTNLGEKMLEEFSGNDTPIISASFDNANGNLNVSQSSEQVVEVEYDELTDDDMKIICSADDDFVRRFTLSIIDGEFSPSEIIDEIASLSDIFAIHILGQHSSEMLCDEILEGYAIVFDVNSNGKCGFIGVKDSSFVTLSATLNVGDLIHLGNRTNMEYVADGAKKSIIPPFVLVPIETSFNGGKINDNSYYKRVSFNDDGESNDECAIITKKCKLIYSCYSTDYRSKSNGVYRISVNKQNIKDLLVLTHDHITGRLIAYVSVNSNITDIKQNQERGQLIITKENNE